ncbi:MAG: NADH-quinone oxidoreductase subunit M [Magnetococcales bacterium]|nr:NADH-quinone oxidoreductase subunit M [Magnetococcales bacterium]
MTHLPWLSLSIALPWISGLLVWLLPSHGRLAKGAALTGGLATAIATLGALLAFDPANPGFQLVEKHPWIPSVGSAYHVGIDGISVLFLPMTALLFLAVLLSGANPDHRRMPNLQFALLLFLEGATLGIFCALDTVLFFLFWEMTLIPIHFLIALWGIGPDRRHAATKYTLTMLAGGVFVLFGLLLAALHHSPPLFDLPGLLADPAPHALQWPIFLLLLVGFGVKVPLVPLHNWLITVAMEGPAGIAAIMTGLKLGAYGLLRFLFPLAPMVVRELHWLLAGLGVVAILYGGLAAVAQGNPRRMLACASIAHVGLVVLGLASLTRQGVQGALLQLVNFSLASGGLFLLLEQLRHRTGSLDPHHLGGIARPLPWLAFFCFLFGLAGIGMPLTSGFPGELLLLVGVLQSHLGAGLAALAGVILGAAAFFEFYRQTFLGPLNRHLPADLPAPLPREWLVMLTFGTLILLIGLHPAPLLEVTDASARLWLEGMGK